MPVIGGQIYQTVWMKPFADDELRTAMRVVLRSKSSLPLPLRSYTNKAECRNVGSRVAPVLDG